MTQTAELGALTGRRIPSEVWPLRWNQIDSDEYVVRWEVGRTKNCEGPHVFQRGKKGRPIFSSESRARSRGASPATRHDVEDGENSGEPDV